MKRRNNETTAEVTKATLNILHQNTRKSFHNLSANYRNPFEHIPRQEPSKCCFSPPQVIDAEKTTTTMTFDHTGGIETVTTKFIFVKRVSEPETLFPGGGGKS